MINWDDLDLPYPIFRLFQWMNLMIIESSIPHYTEFDYSNGKIRILSLDGPEFYFKHYELFPDANNLYICWDKIELTLFTHLGGLQIADTSNDGQVPIKLDDFIAMIPTELNDAIEYVLECQCVTLTEY